MEKFDFKTIGQNKNGPIADATQFQSGFDKIFAPFAKSSEPKPATSYAAHPSFQAAPTPPAPPPAPVEELFTAKELTQSKSKGFEEGYAKGYSDAKSLSDDINKKLDESLQIIINKLTQVMEAKQFDDEKDVADVAEVVVRIAKKVAGSALTSGASDAVEKVVRKSFQLLFDEPKILISVGPDIAQDIADKVALIAKSEGFKGQFDIKINNNLSPGSCNVEWQGGGVKSDKDVLWNEIDKLAKESFMKKAKKK